VQSPIDDALRASSTYSQQLLTANSLCLAKFRALGFAETFAADINPTQSCHPFTVFLLQPCFLFPSFKFLQTQFQIQRRGDGMILEVGGGKL
jgi:hypothetical protein